MSPSDRQQRIDETQREIDELTWLIAQERSPFAAPGWWSRMKLLRQDLDAANLKFELALAERNKP